MLLKGNLLLKDNIVDERVIVRKKSSKRYINGVDFHNSLIEYYKNVDNNPDTPITSYIGECVMKIAERLSSKINFSSYTYKSDMVGDAIEKMIEAVVNQKYDAEISTNPFAYFSQIAYNSFLQRIDKEKKQAYILHKNLENMNFDEGEDEADQINDVLNNHLHNKIIDDFEKPKDSGNYAKHKNLSYAPNRAKKGRRKKEVDTST